MESSLSKKHIVTWGSETKLKPPKYWQSALANGSRWKKFLLARFACKDLVLAYGVCFDNHTFYRPRFIDDNICFGDSFF